MPKQASKTKAAKKHEMVMIQVKENVQPTPLRIPFPYQHLIPNSMKVNKSKAVMLKAGTKYLVPDKLAAYIKEKAPQWF